MLELYVRLSNWLKSEEGQGLIEYALIAVLIAIAAIGIMAAVGSSVNNVFTTVNSALEGGS